MLRRARSTSAAVVAICLLVSVVALVAQDDTPRFRSGVQTVQVTVTVTDRSPYRRLVADDPDAGQPDATSPIASRLLR